MPICNELSFSSSVKYATKLILARDLVHHNHQLKLSHSWGEMAHVFAVAVAVIEFVQTFKSVNLDV